MKGEKVSYFPSLSPVVKSFTTYIGVYIAGGHTGQARKRAPTFECRGLRLL